MLTLLILLTLLTPTPQPMTQHTDDTLQIEQLYKRMCQAMIDKDTAALNAMHADNFVLEHMTGMQQTKQQYIGPLPALTGRSRVTAAVFGGGRHTWRLRLQFTLLRQDGQWLFTHSKASTY